MYNNKMTEDWKLYEAGKKYNNSLKPNYYDTADTNIAFVAGDQWRNLEIEDMPKPVFNIIKRVLEFKVASLTSTNTKIQMEPLAYSEENPTDQQLLEYNAAEFATSEVGNLLEKFKFEHRTREALFDAGTVGDVAAHFWFDRNKKPYGGAFNDIEGEIEFELVDGQNVMFGNANNPNKEVQPYIIIVGRDMVENLKDEAARYKAQQNDIDNIQSDNNYNEQAGDSGKIEVEADKYGKTLYLIVYRRDKKTGTIKVSKCVENAYIYKDIDTGLKYYPIAWFNWEKQKNQYHGRALCTGMLPNQIFINRMFAMVMYHLMLSAFPKPIYDSNKIDLWSNEIGEAIEVNLMPGESIRNVAGYVESGEMSNQIIQAIELAMQYTKELLGVSDASLGNIDPKNTSAIMAVQKTTVIPLENQRGNLYEWVEDIGKILLDMMGTYYGFRPVVLNSDGQKRIEQFDFSVFKELWLNVRVDVGGTSYWSEIASIQTLDNLLNANRIEFIDYLERVPDEYIPRKSELIAKVKQFQQQQEMMMQEQAMQQQMMAEQMPTEQLTA